MITFTCLIPDQGKKRKGRPDMNWILRHPEWMVCQVWTDMMNEKKLDFKCNVHPEEGAEVGIFLRDKRLAYQVMTRCCAAFEEELLRLVKEVERNRK